MALLGFVRGPDSHSGISGLFNRPSFIGVIFLLGRFRYWFEAARPRSISTLLNRIRRRSVQSRERSVVTNAPK